MQMRVWFSFVLTVCPRIVLFLTVSHYAFNELQYCEKLCPELLPFSFPMTIVELTTVCRALITHIPTVIVSVTQV